MANISTKASRLQSIIVTTACLGTTDMVPESGPESRDHLGNQKEQSTFCAWISPVFVDVFINLTLMLFGLVCNSLSCAVLWKDRKKSSTAVLLISLAFTDDLVLLSFTLQRTLYGLCQATSCPLVMQHVYQIVHTVGTGMLGNVFRLQQTWITVLIGFNRYLAVCRPSLAKRLSNPRIVRWHILVVTVFCFIFVLPRFFENVIIVKPDGTLDRQGTDFADDNTYAYVYRIVLYNLVVLVIPIPALLFFTVRMIQGLKESRKRVQKEATHPRENVTLALVLVIVVYMVCQIPIPVRRLLKEVLVDTSSRCPSTIYHLTQITGINTSFNSSINFVLYVICGKGFRNRLRKMLCSSRAGVVPMESTSVVTQNQSDTRLEPGTSLTIQSQ